jgi:N-(2-amino-2-carboxyethyl)-L-glutamate synthase
MRPDGSREIQQQPSTIMSTEKNLTQRVVHDARIPVVPDAGREPQVARLKVSENVLSAVGNTPLVRLKRMFTDLPFQLYAKLESLNPGGSMKDRPALQIIRDGIEQGRIVPGHTVVVESSSGNMGIGLAQVCAYYGVRFICVIDPKTTGQNRRVLEIYGAEINLVKEPDPVSGEYLQARINRVRSLLDSFPSSFWPNQYANLLNPLSHHQTMNEILAALDGKLDYLFCATSTCGTLRGCAEYVREHGLTTKIYAVDAQGSVIFGGQEKKKRLIPGHGAAIRPSLFSDQLADRCFHVTDIDCVRACRRLVRYESILAGGSSGAVLTAVEQARHDIPAGANCVAILPDRGERYLDTVYSDEWVLANLGRIPHLDQPSEEAQVCMTATF